MRGQKGGYILALPPTEIKVNNVLKAMGGVMYDDKFCDNHAGKLSLCTNSIDCSLRSLWTMLQWNMDKLLDQISLADLLKSEVQVNFNLSILSEQIMGSES